MTDMEYIEYNSLEPSKYEEFVPLAKKERDTKILFIFLGTIIISAIIISIHITQTTAKHIKEEK